MIVLASSDVDLRRSYRDALSESYDIVEVGDLAGLTRVLQGLKVRVAFVDTAILPNPCAILRTLSLQHRKVLFIAFVCSGDSAFEINLLESGVRGILKRDSRAEIAPTVVKRVLQGELWVSRRVLAAFLDEIFATGEITRRPGDPAPVATAKQLSARELRVARIAANGLTNKEIAGALGIAERTVKGHMTRLYKKLGISGRSELILLKQASREAAVRPPVSEAD